MRRFFAICLAVIASAVFAQDTKLRPGLAVTYQSGDASALTVMPNFWLFVPVNQSPSPFLPVGRFTATFEGFVRVDLRGDYSFQVIGKGGVKLEVNNAVILDFKGITGVGPAATTKIIRLNKGVNSIKLTYASPSRGDAQLRLFWSERPDKPLPHEPILNKQLFHNSTAPLAQAILAEKGREIFLESRCIRCHASKGEGIPEMAMSGPSFANIGDRRHSAWMAQWILDPKTQRGSARMPRMLHGTTAMADSQAMAAYLGTLKGSKQAVGKLLEPDLEVGMELVEKLNCAGCHNLPGTEAEKGKLNLDHINQKFPQGELAAFLRAPNAHFEWTRMPKFNLTQNEAGNIAQWLRSKANQRELGGFLTTGEDVKRGKELVAMVGCLNCHNHKQENKFKAPDLAALTSDKWMSGCLANEPTGKSPYFGFKLEDSTVLRAFATSDRKSLHRHEPAEFARRQIRLLNCAACHGELEGFPRLDMIGEKLKPEWMQTILDGSLKQRPRPWLTHRMPVFPARAKDLAHGLAMGHGHAPKTPAEKTAIDLQMVEEGRKLVGVDGGFSCVACHGVKNRDPLQVFEAQGVNFSRVGARLQPDYYLRWMLDPLRVDPQTRMPDYFDEDARSVLVDVLEGDAKKQIEAIRQYLRQGKAMKIPVMQ
ncbi:MAG: c-type cytochrome [Verrucomicrobiota bacterium]|jgi:mono/diheme cytochrome c family protein|nr:c-type cytochrome [Verrucomicrobiota bacterium]